MVPASRVRLAEGECSVNGCDGPVHAHGMCRSHYDRWRRSGSGARKRRMSRACLACGSFFETERRDKAFCSARCRKRFQRLKAEGAAPNRTPQPLKSVLWEPRSNARVGRRGSVPTGFWTAEDEWNACSHTCPVCGLPLDRSVDVLSDDFPVGAWRVPLEQGGENSLANRIVVHRRCA